MEPIPNRLRNAAASQKPTQRRLKPRLEYQAADSLSRGNTLSIAYAYRPQRRNNTKQTTGRRTQKRFHAARLAEKRVEGETHRGSGWRCVRAEARGAAGWSRTEWPGRARGS